MTEGQLVVDDVLGLLHGDGHLVGTLTTATREGNLATSRHLRSRRTLRFGRVCVRVVIAYLVPRVAQSYGRTRLAMQLVLDASWWMWPIGLWTGRSSHGPHGPYPYSHPTPQPTGRYSTIILLATKLFFLFRIKMQCCIL